MKRIEIVLKEGETAVEALEEVLRLAKEGFTSSNNPSWETYDV